MKNKLFSSVVLLLLLFSITACGKNDEQGNKNNVADTSVSDSLENGKFTGSIFDLFENNKSQKCVFSTIMEDMEMSGVTYVGDNKIRQEIINKSEMGEMEMNILIDGDVAYTWGTTMPGKGTKMTLSDEEDDDEELDNERSEMDDFDIDYEYDCSDWKVDNDQFDLPTDVEFMDLDKMMNDMESMMKDLPAGLSTEGGAMTEEGDMTQSMCGMCDMSPDPKECKKSLSCD